MSEPCQNQPRARVRLRPAADCEARCHDARSEQANSERNETCDCMTYLLFVQKQQASCGFHCPSNHFRPVFETICHTSKRHSIKHAIVKQSYRSAVSW